MMMMDNNIISDVITKHIDVFLLQTHYLILYPMKKIAATIFKQSWTILPSYIICSVITCCDIT